MVESERVPPTEFPASMGRVAPRELAAHGYTRFDQLTGVTAGELLKIHGVGPKAIRVLERELAARGLSFADG
ncbi:helix-hairpin-helix domain-containing protein [Nocardiopsis lambiniae]|uniref:DNA-binding protein n=1 Tax=Nocardiopsis lambiniae TaxID=3075539 RepID=A0ABU2MDA4_9ACTN|nr:hypothetical protein [Nocardiopsis sp. DSM 44743]MDT0330251.1 hypothetical protein [Nocardiopsis sp. DSM 44743]